MLAQPAQEQQQWMALLTTADPARDRSSSEQCGLPVLLVKESTHSFDHHRRRAAMVLCHARPEGSPWRVKKKERAATLVRAPQSLVFAAAECWCWSLHSARCFRASVLANRTVPGLRVVTGQETVDVRDRKSTRLNSSHIPLS